MRDWKGSFLLCSYGGGQYVNGRRDQPIEEFPQYGGQRSMSRGNTGGFYSGPGGGAARYQEAGPGYGRGGAGGGANMFASSTSGSIGRPSPAATGPPSSPRGSQMSRFNTADTPGARGYAAGPLPRGPTSASASLNRMEGNGSRPGSPGLARGSDTMQQMGSANRMSPSMGRMVPAASANNNFSRIATAPPARGPPPRNSAPPRNASPPRRFNPEPVNTDEIGGTLVYDEGRRDPVDDIQMPNFDDIGFPTPGMDASNQDQGDFGYDQPPMDDQAFDQNGQQQNPYNQQYQQY